MTADLTQLFEQYYASLVRMLYRRVGDRDRAEAELVSANALKQAATHHTRGKIVLKIAD